MLLVYIGQILSLITFVIYLVVYIRKPQKGINYFIYFLGALFLIDTIGMVLKIYEIRNEFLYNILTIIEFNSLFILYYYLCKEKVVLKMVKVLIILFNVILIVSSIFYGSGVFYNVYNTFASSVGAVFVSIMCLLYFKELLNSDDIIYYKKNIFFWITIGLLFYYLGTLPFTGVSSFLTMKTSVFQLFYIQNLMTIIMHSCFISGVIWGWKKTT